MPRSTALLALVSLCGAAPSALAAQTPTGTSPLNFGVVIPGVTATVSRTDALRAGQFQIQGKKGDEVRIDFVLPAALQSGSWTIPLTFGAGDGGYSQTGSITTATPFDPRAPLFARINPGAGPPRLYLYLGGRASPSGSQAVGSYTANVVITVSYTGN